MMERLIAGVGKVTVSRMSREVPDWLCDIDYPVLTSICVRIRSKRFRRSVMVADQAVTFRVQSIWCTCPA